MTMPAQLTVPLACLAVFALWTVLLIVVGIGPYRIGSVLMGKAKPGEFTPAVPHGPDWYQRVMRIPTALRTFASARHRVINLRFACFLTQLTCFFALGGLMFAPR